MLPRPLLLLALLHAPMPSLAQSLDRQDGGAACLALAGACTAAQEDPAALWLNPAAMVGSRARLSVGMGLDWEERSVHRLRPTNPFPASRDAAGGRPLGYLALAQPFSLGGVRLAVGVGYRLGLNSGSSYPATYDRSDTTGKEKSRNDPARYLGTGLELQEHLVYIGLALGWKMLQLGAALELGHLRLSHQRSLWAGEKADDPEKPDLDVGVSTDLATPSVAPGALFGVLVKPHPLFAAGVSVRLPVSHGLEGDVSISDPAKAPKGYTSAKGRGGDAVLDLHLPMEVRAGLSAGWPLLRFNLDLVWVRWSTTGRPAATLDGAALVLTPDGGGAPVELRLATLPLALGLQDRLSLSAGLISVLPGGFLTLRGGYAYHQGATDPDLPSAVIMDLERHVMALGLELALKPIRVGVALAHSFGVPLETEAAGATLDNPVSPTTTANVGHGRYEASATRVLIEVQAGW